MHFRHGRLTQTKNDRGMWEMRLGKYHILCLSRQNSRKGPLHGFCIFEIIFLSFLVTDVETSRSRYAMYGNNDAKRRPMNAHEVETTKHMICVQEGGGWLVGWFDGAGITCQGIDGKGEPLSRVAFSLAEKKKDGQKRARLR
jgi:hypothetical protein